MTVGSIQIPVTLDTEKMEAALARIELLIYTLHGDTMSKLSELEAFIVDVNAGLAKARTEILDKIGALEDALADVELPAGAAAALTELGALKQALDDVVPDAVPPVA
jgi:hypothetical protein